MFRLEEIAALNVCIEYTSSERDSNSQPLALIGTDGPGGDQKFGKRS
jgi:hypothetical protein